MKKKEEKKQLKKNKTFSRTRGGTYHVSVGPRIALYIFILFGAGTSKPTYLAFYIFILFGAGKFGAGNEVSCYVITIRYNYTISGRIFCIFNIVITLHQDQ